MTRLAVFPIPVYLLPEGSTKLRIFEPRYIRMVKECVGEQGFALSLSQPSNVDTPSPWAAWVEITDFDSLDNGLLGITIRAKSLVSLSNIVTEPDGLLKANISPLAHWASLDRPDIDIELQNELKRFLDKNHELSSLYPKKNYSDPIWVCSRWLEILPLNYQSRQQCIAPDSFNVAQNLIKTIVLGN